MNKEERELLNACKSTIEQERDSTALKQIFLIGVANVLHDKKLNQVLGIVFKNKRNNRRLGIQDFE